MAAVTSRAPRVVAKHTSMSAAALRYTATSDNFPAAWLTIWRACGGILFLDKGQVVAAHPVLDDLTASSIPAAGFHLDTADEQRGALKALSALLHLAGADGMASLAGMVRDISAHQNWGEQ